MKGAGAKTKKAKVTSTPFNPAAWSEKTRMVADGSYLDLSRNVTVGQHDVLRDLAKKEKEDRGSKLGNSAATSKGDISNPLFCFYQDFYQLYFISHCIHMYRREFCPFLLSETWL